MAVDIEAARQSVLDSYNILDTLDEQAYDDITSIAATIFGTPVALISFVDRNRQWFKSKIGMPPRETSRDMAFCAHAILNPDHLLIVPDTTRDSRFKDFPNVTDDPHIRFYAGAPLVAPTGEALGTICVIDHKPREFEEEKGAFLKILARQVVAQLELRRAVAALADANARLAAQSMTDALTCIANRRAFNEKISEEIARCERSGARLALLMIDIDRFKSYNDSFGHVAGDATLFEIANVLRSQARPYDFIARFGGEEFAAILPATGLTEAAGVAERLRAATCGTSFKHREITASIGIAAWQPGEDDSALIHAADQALYAAKARGRNCIAIRDQGRSG